MRILCLVLLTYARLRPSYAELGSVSANSKASTERFLHERESHEKHDAVEEGEHAKEFKHGGEGEAHGTTEALGEMEGGHEEGHQEGHEEGHGEGHEEEEEHELDGKQVTGSVFLLGGVVFVMSLFYLVNNDDADIKAHSWKVISATISIFVAVLVFQGFNGVLDQAFKQFIDPEGSLSETGRIVGKTCIAYAQFAAYYCSMHLLLIQYAFWHYAEADKAVYKTEDDFKERRTLKMVAWSTLFAHVSGFSLIMCMLNLMQLPAFKASPGMSLIPVLLNIVFLIAVFRISEAIRSRTHDIRKDMHGKEHAEHGDEMWEEHSGETENEIAAISLSFGFVTTLRYFITGHLPNTLGLIEPPADYTSMDKTILGVLALVFAALAVVILWASKTFLPRNNSNKTKAGDVSSHRRYSRRWIEIASSTSATCGSWCLMFAAKWCMFRVLKMYWDPDANPNECLEQVLLAMIVTLTTIALVFGLDWLKDQEETGDEADKAILLAINALAILVGFTWEKAFDSSVEIVSEVWARGRGEWFAAIARFALALSVFFVMVPAWRRHILKYALRSSEAAAQLEMEAKSSSREGDSLLKK